MAQQSPLAIDREAEERRRRGILPNAGPAGTRTLNFIGGQTDPTTGNIIPGSPVEANRGQKPTGSEVPIPEAPKTPLGDVVGEETTFAPMPKPAPLPAAQPAPAAQAPVPATAPSSPSRGDPSPGNSDAGRGPLSIGERADYTYGAWGGSAPSGSSPTAGRSGGGSPGTGDPIGDAISSPGRGWSGGDDFGGGGGGGGGSGTVLCTYFYRKGMLPRRVYVADMNYAQRHASPAAVRGYHVWAVPLVNLLQSGSHPCVEAALYPVVRCWAHEMAFVMGVSKRSTRAGRLLRRFAEPVCALIGHVVGETDWRALWATK